MSEQAKTIDAILLEIHDKTRSISDLSTLLRNEIIIREDKMVEMQKQIDSNTEQKPVEIEPVP